MTHIDAIHKYLNRSRNLYFIRSTIKGILLFTVFVLVATFMLFLTDLAIHFPYSILKWIRVIFVIFIVTLFIYYLIRPLWFWFVQTNYYSKYWIAQKIGDNDPKIDDKLVNILELESLDKSNLLVQSSILQKSQSLNLEKVNPFFRFSALYKQLYAFILSIAVFALLALISPDTINYTTQRIFPFKAIQSALPYKIQIKNKELEVKKGDDYTVRVGITGHILPDRLFINYGNQNYLLNDSAGEYTYTFQNVQQDLFFTVKNNEFESQTYKLTCIPVPVLKKIRVKIHPPDYTQLEKKEIEGSGNFTFAYGSKISWIISTFDTDSILFATDTIQPMQANKNDFSFEMQSFSEFDYKIIPKNNFIAGPDTVAFSAQIIPDQFPTIHLETSHVDPLGKFVFAGKIQDDYGFHNFSLVLENQDTIHYIKIPIISKNLTQGFRYTGHLNDYKDIIKNSEVKMYLEIRDNDPFYPYKPAKSTTVFGNLPDKKSLQKMESAKLQNLKDKLSMGSEIMKQLNKERQLIRKKLLSEELGNWEKNQLSEQIQTTNQEIKKLSDQINKLRDELKEIESNNIPENLAEKKNQLEELLKKLMDEELQSLMKELDKLRKELMEKDKKPDFDKFDISMEDLENELDRNLEMLKRYEVEKANQEVIDEIKELSKKYNQAKDTVPDESYKTDSLNKQVEEAFEKHQEALEKNKELKTPYELENFKKEKQEISEKSESIENQQELSDPQKNPSEDLQQLAEQMQMNMNMAMQQQQGEDAAMIRELLENLLQFSFLQEDYIEKFNQRNEYNFNELKRDQISLKERFSAIEDSLQGLMERNAMVAGAIGDQLENIYLHFSLIDEEFKQERFKSIQIDQQVIMESANELILMLNESLKQMQNSMSGMGGNCKKQGKKSKPGMGDMKKQQKGFKKSLEEMIDQLKKGSSPGKGKGGNSKELSKMLSQQEQMQQLLQEMMQSDGVGKSTRQILKQINSMVDKNIDDIIQRNINDNMLKRQQKIMTRMLQAEKAEMEREKEKKREAEQPNDYEISNPGGNIQYKGEQELQKGIIQKQEIHLKYFFQRKYDKYVNKIENN